ncbi:unnamed protein product, partial [marine sediment metagenome]
MQNDVDGLLIGFLGQSGRGDGEGLAGAGLTILFDKGAADCVGVASEQVLFAEPTEDAQLVAPEAAQVPRGALVVYAGLFGRQPVNSELNEVCDKGSAVVKEPSDELHPVLVRALDERCNKGFDERAPGVGREDVGALVHKACPQAMAAGDGSGIDELEMLLHRALHDRFDEPRIGRGGDPAVQRAAQAI